MLKARHLVKFKCDWLDSENHKYLKGEVGLLKSIHVAGPDGLINDRVLVQIYGKDILVDPNVLEMVHQICEMCDARATHVMY